MKAIDNGDGTYSIAISSPTISTHIADLSAHTYNWFTKHRVGDYFFGLPVWADAAVAVPADRIYASPFVVARDLTVDRIVIEVTAADPGKIARLGIYEDGTNLYPGALVIDASTVSVAAIAEVAATIDQALTKGLYWLVFVSDGTPAVRWHRHTWSPMNAAVAELLRSTAIDDYWYKDAVGSGALADPFVAGAARTYGRTIAMALRLKSLD